MKDEKKYKEKFLYFWTADFHHAWKIFSLLMVTFIPSLFNKIMKYAGHVWEWSSINQYIKKEHKNFTQQY